MLNDYNSKNNNSSSTDKLRYTLAILLSMGILMVWTFFFQPSPSTTKEAPSEIVQESQKPQKPQKVEETQGVSTPPSEGTPPPFQETLHFEEKIIFLENETLKVGIATLGGVITEAIIRFRATEKSREMVSPDLEEIKLDGFETGNIFFNKPPVVLPDKISYQVVSKSDVELIIEGRHNMGNEVLTIIKKFTLDKYQVKMTLDFRGRPNLNYYLVNGSGLSIVKDKNSFYNIINLGYNIEDTITTPLSKGITSFFTTLPDIEWVSSPFDWISVDNRFYARILKPLSSVEQGFFMHRSLDEEEYNISGISAIYQDTPQDYVYYYLPKSRNLLDEFYDQEKEYFFNLFHQFGFMRIISSVMYWVIETTNGFVMNYGWSILIMTFLLKLVVFPLQQKSMKSMQRMQELSPKIKAIRENFKNKPQKMNQELMALYKKEGVNPLGGCLPMLIPLPVFIALYSLFTNMVEIQGSSFLWIEDLSLPDKLFEFGSELPLIGSEFHLLPVIVMVSSLLQSYVTPQAPTTPENQLQMKMMKYMMPFFFFFISWNMSSALILYWTAQNIFTIGQTFLVKKTKKKIHKKIS